MPKQSTRAAWSGLALVALLAVGSTDAWGQELPPAPAAYFNDHAGLVSTGEAARLEEKLRKLDQETSTQVVVAVFPRLPSPSLEDFTARTAEAWRVGRDELDNGAVLFVFVDDKKMRIEVGYGLEGALPDALAGRILTEQVSPRFREGDWTGGLEAGIDGIVAAVRGEYTAPPRPARKPGRSWSTIVIVLFLIVLFLLMSRMGPPGHPGRTYGRGGRRRDSTHWGGGHWGGGGGFGGGGGGGGFMGGGGSFGGGGASGSW